MAKSQLVSETMYLSRALTIFIALTAVFAATMLPARAEGDTVRVGQSDSIAYSRVFAAILTEAGIDAEFVAAPHGRKRRMFMDGVIVMDCCASPIWRRAAGEVDLQVFSDAFYQSPEHYVFREGQVLEINKPEDLRALRVAKVRGFNYQNEPYFGETISVRDMEDVLDLLVAGRADVGMINGQDFRRRMRLQPRPLELGQTYFTADLRVRIRNNHVDLLPRINAAIATLKANGKIEEILSDSADTPAAPTRDGPITLKVGQSDSEGFEAAWRAILLEAGITPEFVDVPVERKRRLFAEGAIVLDCCAAPMWRMRAEEMAVQRWSDTFYLTREQFVFPEGRMKEIDQPEDLLALRVATIAGFDYQDRSFFGVEVPGRNMEEVLKLIAAGRADVGIISNVDFLSVSHKVPAKFVLGDVRVRAQQKVRVHQSVAYLLPRINAAITRLNQEGRLIELLEKQHAPEGGR